MVEASPNPAFAAAIAEIDRQIAELERAKAILMGRSGGGNGDPETSTGVARGPAFQGDTLAAVREQEFSGMSPAKAARALLLRIGRHERTPTIIAAIRKGGVGVGGKHPVATMYTSLKRHSAFVSLGKNYWDLAERRPDLVRAKSEKKAAKKSKPSKKPIITKKTTSKPAVAQTPKPPIVRPKRTPVLREDAEGGG